MNESKSSSMRLSGSGSLPCRLQKWQVLHWKVASVALEGGHQVVSFSSLEEAGFRVGPWDSLSIIV
jgi:hypothetical protein